jgi:hypothetical protein
MKKFSLGFAALSIALVGALATSNVNATIHEEDDPSSPLVECGDPTPDLCGYEYIGDQRVGPVFAERQ